MLGKLVIWNLANGIYHVSLRKAVRQELKETVEDVVEPSILMMQTMNTHVSQVHPAIISFDLAESS